MNSSQRAQPLRVDHVGSLIRPPELMEAFHKWEAGEISAEALSLLPDRYIAKAVALQEQVGLQAVTDGEFRRRSWQRGFIDAVGGFAIKPGPLQFRNESGPVKAIPAMFVAARLKRVKGIVTEDYKALKKLTKRTPKVTLPAPSAFHLGLFDQFVDRAVYPDIEEVFEDLVQIYRAEIAELASLGCTLIQLDEVGLAAMCDPHIRAIAAAQGDNPEKIIDRYFDMNRRILADRPAGMTICMHLCRGNQAGLWLAQGSYEPVAERLFNEPGIDSFLLEYDSPRAGDFAPLRHMGHGKIATIGIVSTKNPQIESEEFLKRRIHEAAQHLAEDSLAICPQCGFASSISSWNVTANPMTEDVQRRKLERLVKVAADIWR